MRFVFAVLLATVAVASASIITSDKALNELKLRNSFGLFKANFGKFYDNSFEEEYRFSVYKENLAAAEQLNIDIPTATFGETRFSDLTTKEFKQFFKGYKKQADRDLEVKQPTQVEAPTSVDWVAAGYTTAVKNQGQCGSCWAFSAVQGLESAWAAAKNLTGNLGRNIPVLSPEQVVDCDKTDAGCNGGDLPPAFAYMQKTGVTSEALYPYVAGNGKASTCKSNITAVATMRGFVYATPACKSSNSACTGMDETLLATNLAQVGPSAVCVNAEGTRSNPYVWQNYVKGVVTGYSTCPGGYNDLDHCVLLTGYGVDATTGVAYWTVKNSWGTSWGEAGYIRLQRGVNMCGIADEATFVTI